MNKKFSRKHLVFMSLGNIIGSGLFLGSSTVLSVAGPAAILSYLFGGFIMALEVMFITEMCVIHPAPGAFRVHASEIFGPWIGFVNGWMFWFSGVLGMASEVAAAAVFTSFWFPNVPLWIFCLVYAVVMTGINLKDVRGLSEIEMILASVKVIALVFFILFGFSVLLGFVPGFSVVNRPFASWESFLPKGVNGVFASMIMVMFSFTGTGIIGLAIAETEDPARNAPAAIFIINAVVILLYSISALFLVLLIPWDTLSPTVSPFVTVLNRLKIPFSDSILNFIVLSAALSGLNSSMYSSSRMLNSLSRGRQAPAIFLKNNKNGVPVYALVVSSVALLFTAVLSYWLPQKVFVLLATASGFLAMFNWLTISVTHYFYRRKTLRENPEKLRYKAPGYPFTCFLEAVLILAVLATSPFYEGQVSALVCGVILFAALILCYLLLKKLKILT
ncbi:amino acid permease [Caproiciproducens galactitolivorans]|uniref:GABA permease n=1 Tax=Caproiciproducens galactitolivorans TaxID=642589 RepID=A0A4Z0XZ12_9FIRM|nr:amino acid permease [Caproiciproducens galactitolivorans]QEY35109.1 amino acid permease [Caproiciproducens galactitolivorans]TGJ76664.1 GABA permease [Caproiciproducens galactitolivorans]